MSNNKLSNKNKAKIIPLMDSISDVTPNVSPDLKPINSNTNNSSNIAALNIDANCDELILHPSNTSEADILAMIDGYKPNNNKIINRGKKIRSNSHANHSKKTSNKKGIKPRSYSSKKLDNKQATKPKLLESTSTPLSITTSEHHSNNDDIFSDEEMIILGNNMSPRSQQHVLKLKNSASQPNSPLMNSGNTPKLSKMKSRSANNSPIITSKPKRKKNGKVVFPTFSINTDNARKVSKNTPNHHAFKVLLIGSKKCGKSALVKRLIHNTYTKNYKMSLGAIHSKFECKVPIDLIEEIERDNNLTNIFNGQSKLNTSIVNNNENIHTGSSILADVDPFDSDNEDNQRYNEYGFGMINPYSGDNDDSFRIDDDDGFFNGAFSPPNINIENENKSNTNTNNNSNNNKSSSKKSIDYGKFNIIDISHEETNTIKKVSMNLQITLDIVEVGYHAMERNLYNGVHAVILVIDVTRPVKTLDDVVHRYKEFIMKSPLYRRKIRANSTGTKPVVSKQEVDQEYIPVVIAATKCDLKKKKLIKKRDIKSLITKKLMPMIEKHYNTDGHKLKFANDNNHKKQKLNKPIKNHQLNATLLKAPNIKMIYNDDNSDDDGTDFDDDKSVTSDYNPNVISPISIKKTISWGKTGLNDSINDDNTDNNIIDKNDMMYIEIVQCSAKSGKNVEKLFSTCIKKTLPSKLASVSHRRTKTTAHVTAPIWLRKVVEEFQTSDISNSHTENDGYSDVDDDFNFVDEN